MNAALAGIVACSVAWLALEFLLRLGLLPPAHPNTRSLHHSTVAQGAGVAIWAGVAAAAFWSPPSLTWAIPLLIVIAISLWDDWRGLPVVLRLVSHVVAALIWLFLVGPPPSLLGWLATVLLMVWMANLYNFMDGSDGLAAAMTLIGFSAYSIGGWRADATQTPLVVAVVLATVPFMMVNRPPARAFLGDVGAVPLGFLAAALGIAGWKAQWWPAWFPPLVFLPFIADATATILRRLLCGERIWQAHREHYYQRLLRMGFGHAGTLALYAALMVGTAGSALAALVRAPHAGNVLLVLWLAVLLGLFLAIDHAWRLRNEIG